MANRAPICFDEQGHWLGDYDEAGKPKQQAIWLGDLPVALVGSNRPVGTAASTDQKLAYTEADHLNTPRVVIDPERNVAIWNWAIQAEPFGDSQPNQDPDQDDKAFTLDLRLPGQRYDSATGLDQNDQRDYDPRSGRYIQSDPIGLNGGMNPFFYASGNPLMNIDPLGLFEWPSLPQGVVNGTAGFGDTLSFGVSFPKKQTVDK